MSVFVIQFTHIEMPKQFPVATADAESVSLWPAGLGQGPSMSMSHAEWHHLRASADAALLVAYEEGRP